MGLLRFVLDVDLRWVGVLEIWKVPSEVLKSRISSNNIPPREEIIVVERYLNLSKNISLPLSAGTLREGNPAVHRRHKNPRILATTCIDSEDGVISLLDANDKALERLTQAREMFDLGISVSSQIEAFNRDSKTGSMIETLERTHRESIGGSSSGSIFLAS